MAIDTIKSTAVLDGSITSADLSYPLTGFSSTGIDDNADATAITIDSSENVLYGTTDNTLYNNTTGTGTKIGGDGRLDVARQADTVATFNRTGSSNGEVIRVVASGTTVGSIGTHASNITIGTGATGLRFYDTDNVVMPRNPSTGASVDGTISLGEPLNRFKDAYLSGGLYIGGTTAANKLQDYEEGTHQTVATMTGSGTVTLNTSFDRISYTKVGRLVTIIGNPRILTVSSPVGQLRFTLPFTAKSGQTDECRAGFVCNYYDNSGGSGSYSKQVNATVNEASNTVTLDLTNSHGNNITTNSSDEVLFSFSYITA